MMVRARSSLMPGISASRATAVSTGASGPVPATGPGGPVGVDAPGGGHRRGQLGGPGGQRRDPGVEEGDLVQQQPGELAVVVIEHAVQGLDQVIVPGLHPAAGQAGQHLRVALAGDHRLDHVLRRDGGQLGLATDETLTRAPSSSFSSRCQHRVRSWTSRVRARV